MNEKNLNKEKNFISVVAYIKNCENEIQEFLINLDKLLDDNFLSYEFVLVDDNSSDMSKIKIKEISEKIKGNILVIDLAYEHGLETSMLAGVDFSIGDFVFEFDSVIRNYDLKEIMNIYYKSLEGFDIVAASPICSQQLCSKLFYKYLNKISYRKMNLTTETFRIVSRRALNRTLKNREKLRYRKAMYHYSGFDTFIYKYKLINNKKLNKELTFKQKINLASDILINFSNIGMKIATDISIFFAAITVITLFYTVYAYITLDKIQAGWTTMMLILSISFSGIFILLAIISKYLTVIIRENSNIPNYIFKDVDRLSGK